MPPICRPELIAHRPRLLARADQRHRAEGLSPHPDLTPAALVDATLDLAGRLLVDVEATPQGVLDGWLDARLELLITDRWNAVVRDYTDMMTGYARVRLAVWRLPGRRVEPLEVVNEAWINARANGASFRGTTDAEYRCWLLKILDAKLTDTLRWQTAQRRNPNREVSAADSELGPDPFDSAVEILYQSTPSSRLRREEFLTQLLIVVERMPEPDRGVATLTMNGQSPAEIAAELGFSVEKVRGVLGRVLKLIRRELLANEGTDKS